MHTYTTQTALRQKITELLKVNKTIGFVPTMGALHSGHLSLVKKALAENDVVICSVFVNPTQFNSQTDLLAYPRVPEQDAKLLAQAGCHILYMPEASDLYPEGLQSEFFDFGPLGEVMEGKYRPGHFAGMATVVKRLFNAVTPTRAYFGEKDFQQLAIIRQLVKKENLPIEVVGCSIAREADGLAMSSRNLRLNAPQRVAASVIYESLQQLKEMVGVKELAKARVKAIENLNAHPEVAVEYLEIADTETLQPISSWEESKYPRAFVAVFCGEVRLIDNIALY
jgi:pantoate--beta-alanine ligase